MRGKVDITSHGQAEGAAFIGEMFKSKPAKEGSWVLRDKMVWIRP